MPKPKPAHPQPIINVHIVMLDNGTLTISGMPQDLNTALAIIKELNRGVFEHFIELAKSGKLDKDNSLIPSNIITPGNSIIDFIGKRI